MYNIRRIILSNQSLKVANQNWFGLSIVANQILLGNYKHNVDTVLILYALDAAIGAYEEQLWP